MKVFDNASAAEVKMIAEKRLAVVALFAIAMAWVEAACVAYLRTLLHRVEPYQLSPLPAAPFLGATELFRETATLVMLAAVGWLAGRSWRSRFGCFILAFGVWDIFYYLFLKVIVGWPHTMFDWDVLFLLPLPWWGPVLAPMLVSLVLIVLGTQMTRSDLSGTPQSVRNLSWLLHCCGIVLALYAFMEHSLRLVLGGKGNIRLDLPTEYSWALFIAGILLMSAPIVDALLEKKASFGNDVRP